MQRGLIILDSHVHYATPSGRMDDFPKVSLDKLKWCFDYAVQNKCNYIFHGGDFFHAPAQTRFYGNQVLRLLNEYPGEIYMIPGNHDIQYLNMSWFPWSTLASLVWGKSISLLRFKVLEEVLFIGASYFYVPSDWTVKTNHSTKVLIGHFYFQDVAFASGREMLKKEQLDDFNYAFLGHDHKPREEVTLDDGRGCRVIRPGSLARLAANEINISPDREVRIVEFEVDGDCFTWEYVDVPVAPFEEIYTYEQITKYASTPDTTQKEKMLSFLERFDITMDHIFQPSVALEKIREGLNDEVYDKTKYYLSFY
jgi:DNA repair exonuclease SbcCD nuclease subunit